VPALDDLMPGEVGGFAVAGTPVLVCRIGDGLFGYRDRCPACTRAMAGATLTGAVLDCPHCGSGFDVVHAGRAVDDRSDLHLEPVPVLTRDGVPSMAVAQEAMS
jgi:nitrite reductase/ring-hydroxylating ferredoxin subunit